MRKKDTLRESKERNFQLRNENVAAAGVGIPQSGPLTSRQSAAHFPAEDFQSSLIITEPNISSLTKKLPPVSVFRLPATEGTTMAVVGSLFGQLFVPTSGAVITLNKLAREADAARRER